MDVKSAKVLGDGGKVLPDWRKQVVQSARHVTGSARKLVSQQVTVDEPSGRHCKRVRSGGCKNSCRCSVRKSVVKNYSNFMKSGSPQRVMFYDNGEWKDFPQGILLMLKGDFQAKLAITEVVVKGKSALFDFLHMVLIDTETGLQQPIAWIDESGSCFFPEPYSDACELHPRFCSDGEDKDIVNLKPNGTQEIKVQLEIAVNGDCIPKSEECDEVSVSHAKRLRIEAKPSSNDYEKPDVEFIEGIGENVPSPFFASENYGLECKHDKLDRLLTGGSDYNVIQNLFLASFAPYVNVDDIVGIFRGFPTSISGQARLQHFQKQVEIMKTYRGNANVRHAWFTSSNEAVSRIMLHRFEHTDIPKLKSAYGTGIHLIPAKSSHISTSFDVDENGMQHILLCRVIMGNMEVIHPESKQFHPSNENYDSGVDDLQNPKHYVIWDTDMNTRIYPEYVVSFKVSSKVKEPLVVKESRVEMSGIVHPTLHYGQMQCDSTPVASDQHLFSTSVGQCQEKGRVFGLGVTKKPTSPWMPFPMLLTAISSKILHKEMNLVEHHYDEFKRKLISRIEFIKKLRSIVGDDLLRDTIKNLQYNVSCPLSKCEPEKKMR
ncbi:hypothetical protein AAC387_Pa01g3757 [Persea americana]